MNDDTISRQAAIDALEGKLDKTAKGDIGSFYNTIIRQDIECIKQLPSAQPERPFEIQDILDYLDTVLHPIISPEYWNVYSELHDMISTLPSAERRGRWKRIIEDPPVYACTECGRTISTYNLDRYPYCHCGARMEVEE